MAYTFNRSYLVEAPGLVVYDSTAIWSVDDVSVAVEETTEPTETSMYGRVTDAVVDSVGRVTFTPLPFRNWVSTFFPALYKTPSIGGRLMHVTTDYQLKVWGTDQTLHTFYSTAVTKPPTLNLTPGANLFGPVEFTCVVKNQSQLEDTDAFHKIQTGQSNPSATAFALTQHTKQRYTAAWTGVTGFADFEAKDGFVIECRPSLEPDRVQSLTRDFKLMNVTWSVRCVPVGPTESQIYTARSLYGATHPQGKLRSSNAGCAALTITGTGLSIVLTNAVINTGTSVFGRPLRNGEVEFVTDTKFTAGTPGTLVAITAT